MNYSDKDILDLETSLEAVGLESIVKYGILSPDSWPKDVSFENTVIKDFSDKFYEAGISPGFSTLLRFGKGEEKARGSKCLSLEGPAVRTQKLMEEVAEKYNIEDVYIFG
jgi:hypothetical protein